MVTGLENKPDEEGHGSSAESGKAGGEAPSPSKGPGAAARRGAAGKRGKEAAADAPPSIPGAHLSCCRRALGFLRALPTTSRPVRREAPPPRLPPVSRSCSSFASQRVLREQRDSQSRRPSSPAACPPAAPLPPSIGVGRAQKSCGPGAYKDGGQPAERERRDQTTPPVPERAAMCLHSFLLLLAWLGPVVAAADTPGCRMRITSKALELVKQEGLRFVAQELQSIAIPNLHGKEGQFHYNISNVKVTHLHLDTSELQFQPQQHLAFSIQNGSISLRFRRQLLYWFFYDIGSINASAEGVNIHTVLQLSRDVAGRLKIANMSCNASVARIHAGFSGTLRKVYEFLATLITTGMRYLLSQQICPALRHAGLVLLNSLLDTVPVRNPVDDHIGIDYSLLKDPVVTTETIDLDFKGMFFPLQGEAPALPNRVAEPLIRETERMVYMAVSEYFFDSGLFAYYQAGVLSMTIVGDEVPKDLQVLLRASFFGSIMMMSPAVVDAPLMLKLHVSAPPRCTIRPSGTSVTVTALLDLFLAPQDQPPVQLSSMTMEARLSAKVELQRKALRVYLDLRRFRIYSNQSALESLALIPFQGPLKTLLQLAVMPLINEKTKKGVQIPLPEGMDFIKETVKSREGYLTIGADLHFAKGLREVVERLRAELSPSPLPTAA